MSYSSPVPPEFNGLARVFRKKITDDDEALGKVIHEWHQQLRQRWKRKPNSPVRPDMLNAIKNVWLKTATFSRITVKVDVGPGTLDILDVRLIATHIMLCNEWDNYAPSVALSTTNFTISGRGLHSSTDVFAEFGFHALARYFQRCDLKDRGNERLKECIEEIILQEPPDQEQFVIPTSAGAWRGQMVAISNTEDRRNVLQIRTFVEEPRVAQPKREIQL